MLRILQFHGRRSMVRVRLNNKFYKKDAVEQAIADFKDICNGKIIDDEITVELNELPETRNQTPEPRNQNPNISNQKSVSCKMEAEFSNYVLGLMKNKNLV